MVVVVQILMIGVCKYDPQDDVNEGFMNKLYTSAKVNKHVLQSLVNYIIGYDFFNIMLVCKTLSNVRIHDLDTFNVPAMVLVCSWPNSFSFEVEWGVWICCLYISSRSKQTNKHVSQVWGNECEEDQEVKLIMFYTCSFSEKTLLVVLLLGRMFPYIFTHLWNLLHVQPRKNFRYTKHACNCSL